MRVYEACAALGVPVVITSSHFIGPDMDHARPVHIQRAALALPEVTFIAGHACWPWSTQAVALAMRCPNVYLMPEFYWYLPEMPGAADYVGAANTFLRPRTLFSSCYPSRTVAEAVDHVRALPLLPDSVGPVFGGQRSPPARSAMTVAGRTHLVVGGGGGLGEHVVTALGALGGAGRRRRRRPRRAADASPRPPTTRGLTASAVAVDVRDDAERRRRVDGAAAVGSGLGSVVNAVGVSGRYRIEDLIGRTPGDAARRQRRRCRARVPRGGPRDARRGDGGVIVNVASAAALRPSPGSSGYSATKGAVVAFSRSLAAELATEDIRVWAVCPPAIETGMYVADARRPTTTPSASPPKPAVRSGGYPTGGDRRPDRLPGSRHGTAVRRRALRRLDRRARIGGTADGTAGTSPRSSKVAPIDSVFQSVNGSVAISQTERQSVAVEPARHRDARGIRSGCTGSFVDPPPARAAHDARVFLRRCPGHRRGEQHVETVEGAAESVGEVAPILLRTQVLDRRDRVAELQLVAGASGIELRTFARASDRG